MSTKFLARLTLGATLLLVTFGGFTRGSGSGYGCADRWPLCEDGLLGGLLPRWEYHMVIEWTHRWLAAIVGTLALVTAISAWRHFRNRRLVVVPAVAAVVVIGIQVWVGRLVVQGQLASDLVTLHLVISMTVVALLTVASVPESEPEEHSRSWALRVAVAGGGSFVLLLLGSLVHDVYVSGWPLVGNTLLPDLSDTTVLIHFAHRLVGAALFAYLIYLWSVARRTGVADRQRQIVALTTMLFAVNVGIGALHVFTQVDSAFLVAIHLGLAGSVWALLVVGTTMSLVPAGLVAAQGAPGGEKAPNTSPSQGA